jgi:hypothetical protein
LQELLAESAVRDIIEQVIAVLLNQLAALEKQIRAAIYAVMPSLLELPGVGPIVAGVLLAETGDPKRFASPHHFASYCGAAPVERGSGQNRRMQINPGGNRRLNWALHIVAMVRLRMDGGRSKRFLERAQLRGKTKRSGLRLLKTYIARELFRVLSRGHRQSLLAEADTALTLAEADDELLNGGGPAAGELTGIVAIVPAYDTAADVVPGQTLCHTRFCSYRRRE